MTIRAAVAVLLTLLFCVPPNALAESDSSRLNQERKVIGRSLLEMQAANWQALLPYYSEDVEYHDPVVTVQGIEAMGGFLARLFAQSPDLVTLIEEETCINGIYSASWLMEGSFAGVPYRAKGMSIIKFRDRGTQVYYQRDYYSEGDIMLQIPGLAEPTAAFRDYYRCAVDPTAFCPPQ